MRTNLVRLQPRPRATQPRFSRSLPRPRFSSDEVQGTDQKIREIIKTWFTDPSHENLPKKKGLEEFQEAILELPSRKLQAALLNAYQQSVETLKQQYTNKDEAWNLAEALSKIPHEGFRTAWIEIHAQNMKHCDVRRAAARCVLMVADPVKREKLIETLATDSRKEVRCEAVKLLPYLSDKARQREILNKLYVDEDAQVRKKARVLMGEKPFSRLFLSWYILGGLYRKGSRLRSGIEHLEQMSLKQLDKGDAVDEAEFHSNRGIDQAAHRMAARLQEDWSDSEVLKRRFGDNQDSLPDAGAIKRHYYQMASRYVARGQNCFKRWLNEKTNARESVAVAEALIATAQLSGHVFLKHLNHDTIELVVGLHKRRGELQKERDELHRSMADQMMVETRTRAQLEESQKRLEDVETAFGQAMENNEREKIQELKEAVERCSRTLSRNIARADACQQSVGYFETQIRRYEAQLEEVEQDLLDAMAYGSIQTIHETVERRGDYCQGKQRLKSLMSKAKYGMEQALSVVDGERKQRETDGDVLAFKERARDRQNTAFAGPSVQITRAMSEELEH